MQWNTTPESISVMVWMVEKGKRTKKTIQAELQGKALITQSFAIWT